MYHLFIFLSEDVSIPFWAAALGHPVCKICHISLLDNLFQHEAMKHYCSLPLQSDIVIHFIHLFYVSTSRITEKFQVKFCEIMSGGMLSIITVVLSFAEV